jgi:hypothetical protein
MIQDENGCYVGDMPDTSVARQKPSEPLYTLVWRNLGMEYTLGRMTRQELTETLFQVIQDGIYEVKVRRVDRHI